jgi:peptidoglycan/xylan/chitin deacetylase (PgdA/CDA1 family)
VEYAKVVRATRDFIERERRLHTEVVSQRELDQHISRIQLDATSGHFALAKADIVSLRQALANWNLELSGGTGTPGVSAATGTYLPILMYHYPPPNFEEQLVHLEQTGYAVIDLDEALAGLRGGPLPPKPVVITFDDGFSAQMQAYEVLKRHNMKATFYIIDGGAASSWCIGASRRYGDPLQPPGGCGDAYLNWEQVRLLDNSGLITIGGHTVNHRNLAMLSEADQRFEIAAGKEELERQLGHGIRHLAYPYGAYNEISSVIAREAGYLTAVTTIPGNVQPGASAFALRRVRDAMVLR